MSLDSPDFKRIVGALRATDAAAAQQSANASSYQAREQQHARELSLLNEARSIATLDTAYRIGALAADKEVPLDVVVGRRAKRFGRFEWGHFIGQCWGWRLDEFKSDEVRAIRDGEWELTNPAFFSGVFLSDRGELHSYTRPVEPIQGGVTVLADSFWITHFKGDEAWAYPSARYDTLLARFAIKHDLLPPDFEQTSR